MTAIGGTLPLPPGPAGQQPQAQPPAYGPPGPPQQGLPRPPPSYQGQYQGGGGRQGYGGQGSNNTVIYRDGGRRDSGPGFGTGMMAGGLLGYGMGGGFGGWGMG